MALQIKFPPLLFVGFALANQMSIFWHNAWDVAL